MRKCMERDRKIGKRKCRPDQRKPCIQAGGGGTPRNRTIDVIKAIGIILMVWGHAKGPFEHFISLFHMAIFFIASGFCWNDKYIQSFSNLKKYVLRKLKTLYLPYVLCNGIYTLLTNVFVWCHLYPAESYLDGKALIVELFKNLTLGGGNGFAGATWFLRTLLYISIGHAFWMYITYRLKRGGIYQAVFLVLCAVAAQLVSSFSIVLPKGLHSCFAAYLAFAFGLHFRKYDFSRFLKRFRILIASGCLGLLLVFNPLGGISLSSGFITNLAFYAVVSVAGWVLLWEISCILSERLSSKVAYIGKHTMCIILLHFLAFRFVSVVYVLFSREDLILLSAFPVIEHVPLLWIPYTLVGVSIPLLINAGITKLKLTLKGFRCS